MFNQTLYYNESYGGNTPCYNGNISAMSWKASGDTGLHGYRFRYDGLSRLTSADYLWNGISSTNYSTSYTYNKQSNITSLRRNGRTGASSYGLIDNLTFTLDGNKLTRTDDTTTASAYNGGLEFKDAVKQTDVYVYDKNGNMTKDLNKDITDIQYNCLNLPSKVTFKNGSTITYTYALNGTKLRTVHKIGNTTTTTDYCGNVVYENGVQKLLLTDAGYITLSDKKYHYYLQDHQGNNRVIVDQTGQKEEVNHYYPFGGTFASADGNVQAYKYNGKELDTKKGLNWYDYGARQYDPALGRFTAVDPLTEKYYEMSPYTYCGNNPIKYIDPTGMFYTGYTVNEKGHIKIVSDEGGNYYDVLYNESSYSVKTVKNYDTSGDKTGIKISKGILNERAGASRNMSAKTMKGPYLDVEGHKTGRSYANHSYEIRSDKESLALMNFLDKNTSVEWANTLMKDTQDNSVNLLSTSHHETTVEGGSHQISKYINKGFQVIRADHIHPTPGAIDPSGEKGDMGHAANILKHSPNAIFRILNQGRYYTYKP
ncbi:RHS repeat-associated core domain-containing protein [Bacteroides cellulosilyticus]